MTTSSGWSTQPRAELFKTLSMADSLDCAGVGCSSSSMAAVSSGEGSEEEDTEGRMEASWMSSLRVVSHEVNRDRSSHSVNSAPRAAYNKAAPLHHFRKVRSKTCTLRILIKVKLIMS